MNFMQFAASGLGTRLWLALGRSLPHGVGHAVADVASWFLYRRKNASLYRILYGNQAGVLGPQASPKQIDRSVRSVLKYAGWAAFDTMHYSTRGEEAIKRAVAFDPEVWEHIAAAQATGKGLLICGAHLSNFNLGFFAFSLRGIPMQVLSAAVRGVGGATISAMRNRGLLEETPIDAAALRKALQRLRSGGAASIGVDWPAQPPGEARVPFFGRPSYLQTGYIRLAMSSGAVLLPMAARWSRERGYHVYTRPHLTLELSGDRDADELHNARRVLAVMEEWIGAAPDQWFMYHPVWPAA